MTLMSVSWEEGRVELEAFARAATLPTPDKASPFNHFIKPAPDQMLRVSVGLGLKRARLENVYGVLRGRDAMTGEVDNAKSKAQFALVAEAQAKALSLTNWALVLLNAKALYSPLKVADMIDPAVKGPKAAFEQHHLFPRGYLKKLGITEIREVNQIANFAVVEWPDNLIISDKAPADYAAAFDAAMSGVDRDQMLKWHALPNEWWNLSYEEFLKARRSRMAALVREAYLKLCNHAPMPAASAINIMELLASGESNNVEFKSTLRTNLHTGQHDEKMHLAVLKSIAGFMNAKGGTLLIGISDTDEALGLAADAFESEDKMGQHLVSLIKGRLGDVFLTYAHSHFEDSQGQRVLMIRADPGYKPCFVKDGNASRFYVRAGNTTQELTGNSLTDYVQQRFKP